MNKSMLLLVVLSVFYSACKQRTTSDAAAVNIDTVKFFQIEQYLHEQIKEVEETPFFMYKIDIIDGKKDSSVIGKGYFKQLIAPFLSADINDPGIKKYYKENIFHDETTRSFTISYATANKTLEIQNAEILLQEDGETVKRIFMRKFFNYGDSSAIEQLGWKTGESFQINRLVHRKDNTENSRETTVVWNEKNKEQEL